MSKETEPESADGTETRNETWRPGKTTALLGGLALVLLLLVAAEPALAGSASGSGSTGDCPSSLDGPLSTFLDSLFTFVTVGGGLAAAIAGAGAWGMTQSTSDPQKTSQYKDWRNDAGKTAVGLIGFGMIWDVAMSIIPDTAQASGSDISECVTAFGTMVPVEPVALATDIAVVLV